MKSDGVVTTNCRTQAQRTNRAAEPVSYKQGLYRAYSMDSCDEGSIVKSSMPRQKVSCLQHVWQALLLWCEGRSATKSSKLGIHEREYKQSQ